MGGGVINDTITFYIDNVEYKSPEGYTFAQWVNTSYNYNGWYNNGSNIVNYNTNKGIKGINVNDRIEDNKNYTLGDIVSYSVNDTFKLGKYQVENETPWDIEWEVVDKRDGYVIAMTKQIIDLRSFDAKEPTNTDDNRKNYGNNNWQYSNIEQFLNSDQASWYSAQHQYDAPPNSDNCWNNYNAYNTHKGFLYYWSNEDKSLLKDMTLTLANNTVTDGGGSYTWTGKVWLPTYTQMGFGNNNNIAEGIKFNKFTDNASRIKTINKYCAENNPYCKANSKTEGTNWNYWMSSVTSSLSEKAYYVVRDGSDYRSYACTSGFGLVPCICLPDTIIK